MARTYGRKYVEIIGGILSIRIRYVKDQLGKMNDLLLVMHLFFLW